MLVSVLINSSSTSNTLCFLLFVVGFMVQLVFKGDIMYVWFAPGENEIFWKILVFYPPFNLAKMLTDIGTFLSQSDKTFGFSEFSGPISVTVQGVNNGDAFNVPAPINNIYYLWMNFFIFLLLSLYLDQVITSSHTAGKPLYFFLDPTYWINWKPRKKTELVEPLIISDNSKSTKQIAVKIVNLMKTYSSFKLLPTPHFQKSTAVNDLSLSIEEGHLFTLLGLNGAGKTTTIAILTGLSNLTSGDAFIYGYSVSSEMEKIRALIGYCPQYDILWQELTARQHLQIFATIKPNISNADLHQIIQNKLQQVDLEKVADNPVSTYSGGMKRRLSVLISSIGEPNIIFMDGNILN